MNYVIFNQDGSIREQAFGYYIQQGDNADTIFVSVEGFTSEYVCNAFLTLQTTETLLLAGAYQNNVEYKEGEFADGWVITLSGRATEFNGSVMCAIRLFLNNQIKLSYPLMLIVNETGYRPNEDTGITIEEINSYLLQLQSYQLKYDLHNVRYYSSYSDYQLDLVNLESGQLAIVKEGENIYAYVDNGKIDFDYATKQYVGEIANTKLDKNTSSGGFERVYGVDVGGNQKMFSTDRDYTLYKFENNLVKRFANGQIALPLLPERDENAISKHYGDLTYATKEDVAKIYDILYDTIFVSAEEDFSGVNFIIPSTLTLEDTLPHDIVDKLPLTLKSVKGKTWIKNQLFRGDESRTDGGITAVYDSSTNIVSLSGTATATYTNALALKIAFPLDHKMLVSFEIISNPNNVALRGGALNSSGGQIGPYTSGTNSIITTSVSSSNYSSFGFSNIEVGTSFDGIEVMFKVVDLTKMFGAGNEPTTVEQFNELTANIDLTTYDEGSFINVNISEIETTKQNTTTINTYTLTVSDLNGIGTAQDTITWDGTNRTETKVIEKVNLGDIDWEVQGEHFISSITLNDFIGSPSYSVKGNYLCSKYESTNYDSIYGDLVDKSIAIGPAANKKIVLRDTAYQDPATLKTALHNVYFYYEKATPTSTTTTETALDIDFQTGGYLTIDSEVWADITAEFLVKDWSN